MTQKDINLPLDIKNNKKSILIQIEYDNKKEALEFIDEVREKIIEDFDSYVSLDKNYNSVSYIKNEDKKNDSNN